MFYDDTCPDFTRATTLEHLEGGPPAGVGAVKLVG
jgi:hypothetical protein